MNGNSSRELKQHLIGWVLPGEDKPANVKVTRGTAKQMVVSFFDCTGHVATFVLPPLRTATALVVCIRCISRNYSIYSDDRFNLFARKIKFIKQVLIWIFLLQKFLLIGMTYEHVQINESVHIFVEKKFTQRNDNEWLNENDLWWSRCFYVYSITTLRLTSSKTLLASLRASSSWFHSPHVSKLLSALFVDASFWMLMCRCFVFGCRHSNHVPLRL